MLSIFNCVYLDSVSEPGAESLEDVEAVVQSERVSVLTEEVNQFAAFFLQLLPAAAQRAERRRRTLRHRKTKLYYYPAGNFCVQAGVNTQITGIHGCQ